MRVTFIEGVVAVHHQLVLVAAVQHVVLGLFDRFFRDWEREWI